MNFLNKLLAINLNYQVLTRFDSTSCFPFSYWVDELHVSTILWWVHELEVLIRGKESNELWHLDNLDLANLVDVEMSPGLVEVGGKVLVELVTGESLMGGEDLLSGSEGSCLGHPEFSSWGTSSVGVGLWGLGLDGVVLDHGSHEDIVGIGSESWGGNSLVSRGSNHARVAWNEVITGELNVSLVIGGGG